MRRAAILAAIVLGVVLCAVLALPWWLGSALAQFGPGYGLSFARYERLDDSRFALHGVEFRRANLRVAADRVEADAPVQWLWRRWQGAPGPVTLGGWSVEVTASSAARSTTPTGWEPLRGRLQRIAGQLERWLPRARAGAGIVRWPKGELAVQHLTWENRTLTARQLRYRQFAGDVTLAFETSPDRLHATVATVDGAARAELASEPGRVQGALTLWEQPAAVALEFERTGWLPARGSLEADTLRLPAERLRLGAAYREVAGALRARWERERYALTIALQGTPATAGAAPPLEAEIRASGDMKEIVVDAFRAHGPGFSAALSAPVRFDRGGRLQGPPAAFAVSADLAQLPWPVGSGRIEGEARLLDAGSWAVDFTSRGHDLQVRESRLAGVDLAGSLRWPVLRLDHALLRGDEADELHASAECDFRERVLRRGVVRGRLARATVADFLPDALEFSSVDVDASAEGAFADLLHRGMLKVHAGVWKDTPPVDLRLRWSGRATRAERFDLEADSAATRVTATGSASPDAIGLTALTIAEGDEVRLALREPTKIAWSPVVKVEQLRLAGGGSAVDANVTLGANGRVELVVKELPSRWLTPFVALRGPEWSIRSLAVTGSWADGPMQVAAAGEVRTHFGASREAIARFSARGDDRGLAIEGLHILEGGQPVADASGHLPIVIVPHPKPRVAIVPEAKLRFEADTVPNAVFWQQLAALTGLTLEQPLLTARLGGTWRDPQGELRFQAARAGYVSPRAPRALPVVERVDLALSGATGGFRLEQLSFLVEGQPVRVSGELPVAADAWTRLARTPLAAAQAATLRIEIPEAEIAKFARFLPNALAPAGRIQADLRLHRGELGGFLRLRDAASRPLGPLGVLQQITADVEFVRRTVRLRQVTARSGGQPVTLVGEVELPQGDWFSVGREPRYDIALRGQNLPFVRQAGLLLRGDVDLKLTTPQGAKPRLAGTVTLRDSLFLADVRAYLPRGGGASPSRRPPFFAVEAPPLNAWTLDVDVVGSRFIRVRMPVFSGVASARFRLAGTLGEPRAVGDATVDEGQVLMPFATFDVTQGAVRLTEENPYEPTVYIRGSGRHWGYDLTMEVMGRASAPNITFTSSPALDSDQVLLMVMTGAAPSNEVNSSVTHRAVQIGAFFGQTLLGSLTGSSARAERLSVESGAKISRQGNETYDIEYKLTPRWSLTGEYDEFDEYNVGVKWRVAPRPEDR